MKTIRPGAFLVVCWMLAGLAGFAAENVGEDWPQFLGPRANGTSLETGLLEKWPKEGPPMLWEKAIGSGYSAPARFAFGQTAPLDRSRGYFQYSGQ